MDGRRFTVPATCNSVVVRIVRRVRTGRVDGRVEIGNLVAQMSGAAVVGVPLACTLDVMMSVSICSKRRVPWSARRIEMLRLTIRIRGARSASNELVPKVRRGCPDKRAQFGVLRRNS